MKLKVRCNVGGLSNTDKTDTLKIDPANLEGLTEEQRDKVLHDMWYEWASELLDGSYEVIEE